MKNLKINITKREIVRLMLATSLMSAAGIASAAGPIQLDEVQMDAVYAAQGSVAAASAFALAGATYSQATTYAFTQHTVRLTNAGALGAAVGFGSSATASAMSYF